MLLQGFVSLMVTVTRGVVRGCLCSHVGHLCKSVFQVKGVGIKVWRLSTMVIRVHLISLLKIG